MKRLFAGSAALVIAVVITGCATDADVASHNLSKAADQFEIDRRVVSFNGITDKYLLTIEGRCSILDEQGEGGAPQLEVTCKTAATEFKKHFLGLSDNVTYFVEQTKPAEADAYHYRVIFKPEVLVPSVDPETSGEARAEQ